MDTGPVEGADAPSLAATRAGSRIGIVATTGGGGLNDVCVTGVEPDCGDGGCNGPVSEVQAEVSRRAVGHTHRELHPGVPFRVLVQDVLFGGGQPVRIGQRKLRQEQLSCLLKMLPRVGTLVFSHRVRGQSGRGAQCD